MEANATLDYRYPGRIVVPPTVPPPVSVQEPVFGVLPAAQNCLQDWMLGRFESAQNQPQ